MSQNPPPPPPPPPPAGGSPMPTGQPAQFNVGDAVGYGWNGLLKNLGPMILITLVIVAVNIVVSLIAIPIDSFVGRLIIQAIGWVIGLLLALGLIRASLAVTEGRTPDVNMLFQTDHFGPYIVAAILFGLGTAIGLVLCIVPGIIFAIVFWFFGFVIVDKGEESPTGALKRSADITRGHRGALFGLGLLLMLINFVGALLCGIGLLFTYPLTAIAIAYAYKSLSGEPVAPVA